jgi:hypothetical protein
LLSPAGKADEHLRAALSAAMAVLRHRADQRLSPATAVEILAETMRAVGLRQEFLAPMPQSGPLAGRPLIGAALDVMLSAVFERPPEAAAAWQLLRAHTVTTLVRIGLAQLAQSRLRPELLTAFATTVQTQIDAVAEGNPWDPVAYEKALFAVPAD